MKPPNAEGDTPASAQTIYCRLGDESALAGDGRNIAGAMQDTNNNDFIGMGKVIDRVLLIEEHAQIRGKMRTGSTRERKAQHLIKSGLDAGDKFRCERFRGLLGQVAPDLCEV